MKKRAAALALALVFLLAFAAGGGGANKSEESIVPDMAGAAPAPAEAPEAQRGLNVQYSSASDAAGGDSTTAAGGQLDPEKIIWTADAWIENAELR
jgi:hypothetical protein